VEKHGVLWNVEVVDIYVVLWNVEVVDIYVVLWKVEVVDIYEVLWKVVDIMSNVAGRGRGNVVVTKLSVCLETYTECLSPK